MNDTDASNANRALVAARMVLEHFCPKRERRAPDWLIIQAMRELVKSHPGASPEDLFERLRGRSPAAKPHLMSRYLIASLAAELENTKTAALPGNGIYCGRQKFSFAKISSMASFFACHTKKLCATKLNLLLFYSDFINFLGHGQSISGAKYLRGLDLPMMDRYESVLNTLILTGALQRKAGCRQEFTFPGAPPMETFSILEILTLHWILSEFANGSAADIQAHLHREGVCGFTRRDEYISYEYSRFLERRQDNTLLFA